MTSQYITPGKIRKPDRIEKGKSLLRQVKFESELDREFIRRLEDDEFGDHIKNCIQCGTCSGSCPLSYHMDYTPRRIIAMAREGFREELLNSYTIWLCASCYACTVECPRQIKITDLMYALKREAVAEGLYPKRYAIPIFNKSFYKQVRRHGRQSETRLMTVVYIMTNPLKLFNNIKLGWRLFINGRLSFFDWGIKDKKGLRKLFKTIGRQNNHSAERQANISKSGGT